MSRKLAFLVLFAALCLVAGLAEAKPPYCDWGCEGPSYWVCTCPSYTSNAHAVVTCGNWEWQCDDPDDFPLQAAWMNNAEPQPLKAAEGVSAEQAGEAVKRDHRELASEELAPAISEE